MLLWGRKSHRVNGLYLLPGAAVSPSFGGFSCAGAGSPATQHRTEQRVRLCLKERRKKRDDATKFYRKSRGGGGAPWAGWEGSCKLPYAPRDFL